MGWRRNKVENATSLSDLKKQETRKKADMILRAKVEVYSHAEIAIHDGEAFKDVWIVIGEYVYDVTEFLEQTHPGGPEVIKAFAGKQCDWQFELFHREEHLTEYQSLLLIGKTEAYLPNPFPRPPKELKSGWRIE